MTWKDQLPPECQLLFACARTSLLPPEVESVRRIARSRLDWERLHHLATSQGVVPLVYSNLTAYCSELVPETVAQRMRQQFHANAHHNLLLSGELVGILEALNKGAIPALPFKGPLLAVSAYGDITLREFGDLDILIHKDDIARTKEILVRRGYREDHAYEMSWESTFVNPANGIVVDIHWAFAPQKAGSFSAAFRFDTDGLWRRQRTCRFLDREVPSLSPDDELLMRCQNAGKDFFKSDWPRLAWICDVAQLTRCYPALDWQQVERHAKQFGSRRILYMCLAAAKKLLDVKVDNQVRGRMSADRLAQRLADDMCGRLVTNMLRPPARDEDLNVSSRLLFQLRAHEQWRDKLAYIGHFTPMILRRMFKPSHEDFALVRLPARLNFLYYALRPVRLLIVRGRRLTKSRTRSQRVAAASADGKDAPKSGSDGFID